jgi:hypothetical protein
MDFLEEEEEDQMMDAIVRWRDIATHTNWHYISTAPSQRDVAVAASLHSQDSVLAEESCECNSPSYG